MSTLNQRRYVELILLIGDSDYDNSNNVCIQWIIRMHIRIIKLNILIQCSMSDNKWLFCTTLYSNTIRIVLKLPLLRTYSCNSVTVVRGFLGSKFNYGYHRNEIFYKATCHHNHIIIVKHHDAMLLCFMLHLYVEMLRLEVEPKSNFRPFLTGK